MDIIVKGQLMDRVIFLLLEPFNKSQNIKRKHYAQFVGTFRYFLVLFGTCTFQRSPVAEFSINSGTALMAESQHFHYFEIVTLYSKTSLSERFTAKNSDNGEAGKMSEKQERINSRLLLCHTHMQEFVIFQEVKQAIRGR